MPNLLYCARKEINNGQVDGLFAAIPPLEAKRALFAMMASMRDKDGNRIRKHNIANEIAKHLEEKTWRNTYGYQNMEVYRSTKHRIFRRVSDSEHFTLKGRCSSMHFHKDHCVQAPSVVHCCWQKCQRARYRIIPARDPKQAPLTFDFA